VEFRIIKHYFSQKKKNDETNLLVLPRTNILK